MSEETLFEQAIHRVAGYERFAAPMVVAGASHDDLIAAQLGDKPGERAGAGECLIAESLGSLDSAGPK